MKNFNTDLPIFLKWIDFLKWLLLTTEKFPKKVRFTFSDRINNIAINLVEDLIEARYTRERAPILKRINLSIEKLRVLLRICYEQELLPHKGYEYAIFSLNEVGQMLGGWIKQQEAFK